jgi:hypothetical protein
MRLIPRTTRSIGLPYGLGVWLWVGVLLCVSTLLNAAAAAQEVSEDGTQTGPLPQVVLEFQDGAVERGGWLGVTDEGDIAIRAAAGQVRRVDWEELIRVELTVDGATAPDLYVGSGSALRVPSEGGDAFLLADGGLLTGDIVGPATEAAGLRVRTELGEHDLPFARLAAIRLAHPDGSAAAPNDGSAAASEDRSVEAREPSDPGSPQQVFADAMASRKPGQDVLISMPNQEGVVRAVPGALLSLDAEGGTMRFGGRDRNFTRAKVYAIVLAATPTPKYEVRVIWRNGSQCAGRLLPGAADAPPAEGSPVLHFASTVGAEARIPLDRLSVLSFHSPRLVHVADLTPAAEHHEGRLIASSRPRKNRNVAGGPLRLAGRTYSRGLGMRSHSSVTYALDEAYERFLAQIGIDDAVRPDDAARSEGVGRSGTAHEQTPRTWPGGAAVFRVYVDGASRFESDLLRAGDKPVALDIDVTGAQSLTLEVDYGDGLDLGDYADWAAARLLRRAAPAEPSSP